MSLLTFDIAKCVHTSNKAAICDACVEACPVETIRLDEGRISFVPAECVGCGGCGAVCPTAAYTLDDFNPINYVFRTVKEERDVLSCRDGILPCIAALATEELIAAALLSQRSLTLDTGPCAECPIAGVNLAIIEERAEEAAFVLEAMEQEVTVRAEAAGEEPDVRSEEISRRELLSKDGVKTVLAMKQRFDNRVEAADDARRHHEVTAEAVKAITQKTLPDRRSLLMMAMKRAKVPETFHTIAAEDISFTSQKKLDEATCTACQMCYRICPTGALSSDARNAVINFNPLSCVKCHSCHDVCEPDALTLSPVFSLANFFDPKIETLVRFTIRRCDECGNFFTYHGGETMCERCKTEEEEARALWGIK